MTHPYSEPSQVTADQGQVMVDGPDGMAISFTPEAASETARRLGEGAERAREQQAGAVPAIDRAG